MTFLLFSYLQVKLYQTGIILSTIAHIVLRTKKICNTWLDGLQDQTDNHLLGIDDKALETGEDEMS